MDSAAAQLIDESSTSYWRTSSAAVRLSGLVEQVGPCDVPVLIHGETGSGKEVLARRLHLASGRREKPFLKLNCAALPPELVESELFGYERGAFTGALQSKPGMFAQANGGTLLLDEIGDMELKLQAKLLQVLQDHEVRPLGARHTVPVDVRVIAATHRDLEEAIAEGRFREDLYYRLNVVGFRVPALRERTDEILMLARELLSKHSGGAPLPEFTLDLQHALVDHDWPGNIRELENVMRRFLVFRDAAYLADELRSKTRRRRAVTVTVTAAVPVTREAEPLSLSRVEEEKSLAEREAILAALSSVRWNRKRAAKILNIDYKALLYKMKKLGIAEGRKVVEFPVSPETEEEHATAATA